MFSNPFADRRSTRLRGTPALDPAGTARRTAGTALLLAVPVAAAVLAWPGSPDLAELRLAGPRPPVCERIILLIDDSGSMHELAGPRESAVRTLVPWFKRNLRPDDELAAIDYAASARIRLPATAIKDLGPDIGPPSTLDGRNTLLTPALQQVEALGPTSCDSTLLMISDGAFADLPQTATDGRKLLLKNRIHDQMLLVPGQKIAVPKQWDIVFPDSPATRFAGDDAKDTAVTGAGAVARITGQTLTS